MAFALDPNLINSALKKTGSDYSLPAATPAANQSAMTATTAAAPPPVSAANPAPMAPTAPAATPEKTNDPGAPKPEGDKGGGLAGGLEKTQDLFSGMQQVDPEAKKNEGFQKVGALVGTILSAYTGNAAGVVGGTTAMRNAGK